MQEYQLVPSVDETQEFLEIANDFSNPLELVREGVSNSFDAGAEYIRIVFDVITVSGENQVRIQIQDDGHGMDRADIKAFFDLGNSTRRDDPEKIGEKGHGTKVYFNSRKIEVKTTKNGHTIDAVLEKPFAKLHARESLSVNVSETESSGSKSGTSITVYGYNNNRMERFSHEVLKDYIRWFTKFGSVENEFTSQPIEKTLFLKGLDRDFEEQLPFGHPFPSESARIKDLFDEHLVRAPSHYCKRIIRTGTLRNRPDIRFQAIFSIEGNHVKFSYNPMIRRQGYQAPKGAYTVQQRYGVWLCKDFIPVQRKNEWVSTKGSEFTKFHAFVNCQHLRLTANRGSVENTPAEILDDIQEAVQEIYNDILNSDDWRELSWLEEEVTAHRTVQKEKKDFQWRQRNVNRANIAEYKGLTLVEPYSETGVFSLYLLISVVEPQLFPFYVVDYNTHEGIDVIAKGDSTTPIHQARLFYVEFKRMLSGEFNHTFENVHSIVCWDTAVKKDDTVTDIQSEERTVDIVQPASSSDYTRYFLRNPRKAHSIEVYVLKDYLREKLGIDFRPRTDESTL